MKKSILYLSLFCATHAFGQSWQHNEFTHFNEIESNLFQAQSQLEKGNYPLKFTFNNQCYQPQNAIKLNQTTSLIPCTSDTPQLRLFRKGNYSAQIDMRSGTPTLRISVEQVKEENKTTVKQCPVWNQQPIEIDVSSTFADGEIVRDFYSGKTATVKNGKVIFMPEKNANGLLLLEKSAVKNDLTPKS